MHKCHAQQLQQAAELQTGGTGDPGHRWEDVVRVIAVAQDPAVSDLVRNLNQSAAMRSQGLQTEAQDQQLRKIISVVEQLPGSPVTFEQPQCLAMILRHLPPIDCWTSQLLADASHMVTTWQHAVLFRQGGTGPPLAKSSMFQAELPVRILVDGLFRADCLDGNDLVKLFCCCPAQEPLLQADTVIQIARQVTPSTVWSPFPIVACLLACGDAHGSLASVDTV